jgi:hypothetical protein
MVDFFFIRKMTYIRNIIELLQKLLEVQNFSSFVAAIQSKITSYLIIPTELGSSFIESSEKTSSLNR